MLNDGEKFQQLTDLSVEIAKVNDLDVLLERILSLARTFFSADAGSIKGSCKRKNSQAVHQGH